MALLNNWIVEAAEEIFHGGPHGEHHNASPEDIADAIVRHYPLKLDTLYMPVPRCDSCAHWLYVRDGRLQYEQGSTNLGECRLLEHGNYARDLGISRKAIADASDDKASFVTQTSFGCVQWKEKP